MAKYRKGLVVERPSKPLTLDTLMTICGDVRRRRYHFLTMGKGIFVASCISGKFGTAWLKRAGISIRPCILTYTDPNIAQPDIYSLVYLGNARVVSYLGEGKPDWKSLFREDATSASAAAD